MAEHIQQSRVITETGHPMVGMPTILARIISLIFGIIIAFIVLRIALLLLGASQGNAFVDFVYGVSGVFVAPFYGIFGNTPVYGASVFDLSSLVAIIVYALIDWALVALVTIGSDRQETV
jgi:hypothetical protein